MLETLSVKFIEGNVGNVMLGANAAALRGLTYFICGLFKLVLGNHSVQNSQLKA